jgi:hypothetical protein
MDFLNKAANQASNSMNTRQTEGQQLPSNEQHPQSSENKGGGFLDSLKNQVNAAPGGGRESERSEDMLDKYFSQQFTDMY